MAEPAAAHLRRDAYIYVRQSTLAQTVRNTESLARQYDLAGRARSLGWAEHQVVVVDDDLGRSGASAQGRKGTMSEAELHLLRSRLTEGLRAKAARGELRLVLPAGLDYDDDDHVIITPDEAAREAITCVFRRFGQLGSARQVVVSLRGDGLRLAPPDIRTA